MDMQTMAPARPADVTGKSLGIVVFLLGVAMLISVFGLAYRDLIAVADGNGLTRLLSLPVTLMYKGALLIVMGIVASAIANKGVALYLASRTGGA